MHTIIVKQMSIVIHFEVSFIEFHTHEYRVFLYTKFL